MPLGPDAPRLTQDAKRAGFEHPNRCGLCGRADEHCPVGRGLTRWQEHDHLDCPEPRVVVLCRACSTRVIKPHVRLYAPLDPNDPWAGCMALCIDCRWRLGTGCTHPRAKANGGPGVKVLVGEKVQGFIDGRDYRGPFVAYVNPPSGCEQKEPIQ